MAAQLRFVKLHLNKPQDFWNNVLWTDETKHFISIVKHGGGGLMIWAIPKYSRVKCEAICLTAKAWLKLAHQQDNDPKHGRNSTTECFKKERIKVLQWHNRINACKHYLPKAEVIRRVGQNSSTMM